MVSRALMMATVMIACLTAIPVRAQNLEAGKSPSQIFSGACLVCHKGPRGLLKTVPPGSLPGFLRQHYTTSSEMAAILSAYLLSNGATDARIGGGLTKQGMDARSEPRPAAAPDQAEPRSGRRQRRVASPQGSANPDADDLTAQGGEPGGEPAGRRARNAKRLARPGPDTPEVARPAAEGQPPAAAASDIVGPGGRPLSAKQKLSRRGRPGRPGREEPPKTDAAKTDAAKTEPAKTEPAKTEPAKTEPAKTESAVPAGIEPAKDEPSKGEAVKVETRDTQPKDEGGEKQMAKPAGEGKTEPIKSEGPRIEGTRLESAKGEASKGEATLRAVTPAPKPSEEETRPAHTEIPASPAPPARPVPAAEGPTPAATEASAPPPPPAAGLPAAPISK